MPLDSNSTTYHDLIGVQSIPPLPVTAAALLKLAGDPDVEIGDLARAIERDPGLTARLIGIANSVFYAPRRTVVNVHDAIVHVLGLNLVRNMAFGMAVTGALSTDACRRFDLTEYWLIALGTADLASGLARSASPPRSADPDATYLVGLLHNLGELLMAHLWPTKFDAALRLTADGTSGSLEEAERALMGIDHWAAGAFLARHWQLPAIVAEGVTRLGDPLAAASDPPMVRMLRAARKWVVGVTAGHVETLRVAGVEEAQCEYRSGAFLNRYDALTSLAGALGAA